jgi:hypothetical protein
MDVLLHFEEPPARHWPFVDKERITRYSDNAERATGVGLAQEDNSR